MLRRTLIALIATTALAACSGQGADTTQFDENYPRRPVNIIVYSSAGGATDLANRAIAEGLKDALEVEVLASNMPGALGGAATNYVWNQPRNGYTVAGISEGALGHSVLGLHKKTAKDWDYFMIGGTPGVISVREDSPYQSLADLMTAVEANPGNLSVATSVPGSVWNVQWLNAKKLSGFETKFIPYPGSFPSQTAALTGEVDIVWTGLGEQAEFLRSGKFRPLAIFGTQTVDFNGISIPPITDTLPELEAVMPIDQFVGFAIPNDTPEPLKAKLREAFEGAMKGDAIKQFSVAKASTLTGLSGEAARKKALSQERIMAWTLWEAGIAKVDPATLNIEKP